MLPFNTIFAEMVWETPLVTAMTPPEVKLSVSPAVMPMLYPTGALLKIRLLRFCVVPPSVMAELVLEALKTALSAEVGGGLVAVQLAPVAQLLFVEPFQVSVAAQAACAPTSAGMLRRNAVFLRCLLHFI